MSGKLHSVPVTVSGRFRLPGMGVLRLQGPDAADFLQRQSMNDVGELDTVGSWQWNGLLSARGRVLVLFAALRSAEHGFRLLLPDGDAAHWASVLQRLVFRSKVTIEPAAEVPCIGEFGTAPGGRRRQARAAGAGWLLDFGSPGRERQAWVGTDGAEVGDLAVGDTDGDGEVGRASWQLENLLHGLPRLTPPQRDRYTPQMLGLDRLAAFSVRKGCYPGQEIVARTHFLGQARRALALLGAARPLQADESVLCGEQQATVLDYASLADVHVGVAVLPLGGEGAPCRLGDGSEAIRLPFLDGLARRPG